MAGQREFTFSIDKKTHAVSAHIDGVKGAECENFQKMMEDLLGEPDDVKVTPEYHQQPAKTGMKAGY